MHYLRKYWLHEVYVDNDDDVADGHFYMHAKDLFSSSSVEESWK